MLLLLATTALAGPRIVSVGEPIRADAPGNWPRLFPREDGGWALVTANQSGLVYTGLDASFAREDGSERALVSDSSLIDHGWATCPDGTILHVGMGTRTSEQHTAVIRRFDADLTALSATVVVDDDPHATIVDQPAVCGEQFQGFAYYYADRMNEEGDALAPEARVFLVDSADAPVGQHAIADLFNATGMSLLERDGRLYAISADIAGTGALRIVTLDGDLSPIDDRQVIVADATTKVYWPQAAVDIGGDTFVAYLAQAEGEVWNGQFGDVRLVQLDADWNVVDDVAVYALGSGYGGFQPGLARRDDQLVVTFSEDTQTNQLVVVTLDTTEVDTGTDDTGTGDTDTAVDTDTDTDTAIPDTGGETDSPDTSEDSRAEDTGPGAEATDGSGCGCTSGGAPALGWAAVFALALLHRRERGSNGAPPPAA